MKFKKISVVILFSFAVLSCADNIDNKKVEKKSVYSDTEKVTKISTNTIKDKDLKMLPDLDSLLLSRHNDYLLELHDGNLSFCMNLVSGKLLSSINIASALKQKEEYFIEKEKITYDVLYKSNSFVKIYVEDGDSTIVCGQVISKDFIVSGPIQLEMSKNDFLRLFFDESTLFNEINKICIYDDPMGESMTEFFFQKDRLTKILFSSSNDLIRTTFPSNIPDKVNR